jgi:hypothetical protein
MSAKKSETQTGKSKKATPKARAKKPVKRSSKLRGAGPIEEAHPTVAQVRALHPAPRVVAPDEQCTLLPAIDLDGHLIVDGRHFVTGDVRVSGAIRILEFCCLFVAGDVHAQSFLAEGDFCCRSLTIEDTLYGSYEAGITAAKQATGKIWIAGNHDFELGKTRFEEKYKLGDYKPGSGNPKPKSLPKKHSLSAAAVELMVDRPRRYWEGTAKHGPSDDDWWKLLMGGGVSG